MATWTTPRTWVTDQLMSSSSFNTDIRDNQNFLYQPPACRVSKTNITIPTGTLTTISFDAEAFDTDSMHSTVTNTSRITINTAAKYLIHATGTWAAGGTGYRMIMLRKNGTDIDPSSRMTTQATGAGDNASCSLVWADAYAVGDYLELRAYHTQGADLQGNFTFSVDRIAA